MLEQIQPLAPILFAVFRPKLMSNFKNTVKLVREAGINKLHVFPYSERLGTPAALMPQIPVEVRKERARLLRLEGEIIDD